MDRGAWQAIVHGVTRVGHDLATKPPYCNSLYSTLWEKARVGYFERTASKHVYYLG